MTDPEIVALAAELRAGLAAGGAAAQAQLGDSAAEARDALDDYPQRHFWLLALVCRCAWRVCCRAALCGWAWTSVGWPAAGRGGRAAGGPRHLLEAGTRLPWSGGHGAGRGLGICAVPSRRWPGSCCP
jgi:hypothetical protein